MILSSDYMLIPVDKMVVVAVVVVVDVVIGDEK
jgi:hypothetical protein